MLEHPRNRRIISAEIPAQIWLCGVVLPRTNGSYGIGGFLTRVNGVRKRSHRALIEANRPDVFGARIGVAAGWQRHYRTGATKFTPASFVNALDVSEEIQMPAAPGGDRRRHRMPMREPAGVVNVDHHDAFGDDEAEPGVRVGGEPRGDFGQARATSPERRPFRRPVDRFEAPGCGRFPSIGTTLQPRAWSRSASSSVLLVAAVTSSPTWTAGGTAARCQPVVPEPPYWHAAVSLPRRGPRRRRWAPALRARAGPGWRQERRAET